MKMSYSVSAVRTTAVLLFCTLLALGTAAVAMAGDGESREDSGKEEKKKSEEGAPPKKVSPFVKAMGNKGANAPAKAYSNEDLEKMFGGAGDVSPDTPVATPAAGPPEDDGQTAAPPKPLLEQFQEREKAGQEHRAKIAAAEKRVVEAEQRIKQLEQVALAQRNPYLARPAPPEDEEERAKWESADGKARVVMADQQVQAARVALTKAREELAALRNSAP